MKRHFITLKQGTKLISVALLSAALMAGCSTTPKAGSETKPAAQEQQVKTVKVAPIKNQKIGEPLEQVGDVASSIQLDIVVKSGGEVVEILKKRGESVAKGDVLFRLDPVDVELQRQQNEIAIKSARDQLKVAKEGSKNSKSELQNSLTKMDQAVKDTEKTYSKARNDYDAGLINKPELEKVETALTNIKLDQEILRKQMATLESTNSLAAAENQLEGALLNTKVVERAISNLEVKAPSDGILTEFSAELGMTIDPGYRAGKVQKIDLVHIKTELTETAASLVRGKKELSFYIPGVVDKMKGNVSFLSEVMNTQTNSYSLELEVPNPDKKLKPGAKAQILLTEEAEQVVPVVPTLSIVRESGDTYVFILNGDSVQKRKVELGRINETNQEIISGVKADETLVVSGQHQLKDQEKVQLAK